MRAISDLTISAPRLSLRTKTLAVLVAVASAVALPQVFHQAGMLLGLGTAVGQTFLPMHLSVILVGLVAGPAVGVVSGALAPLASFALSGMPVVTSLPFMVIELAAYGLVAGLMRSVRMPVVLRVLVTQVAGRVVLTLATFGAVALLGSAASATAIWTTTLVAGLPGIAIQLVLLPVLARVFDGLLAEGER